MACSSCNKNKQSLQLYNANKEIQIGSLSNIPQDQLIDMYRQGYSISTLNALGTSNTPKIQSLGIVSSVGEVVVLGLVIVGGYYAYKYYKAHK